MRMLCVCLCVCMHVCVCVCMHACVCECVIMITFFKMNFCPLYKTEHGLRGPQPTTIPSHVDGLGIMTSTIILANLVKCIPLFVQDSGI